jgi:hypothetical protein
MTYPTWLGEQEVKRLLDYLQDNLRSHRVMKRNCHCGVCLGAMRLLADYADEDHTLCDTCAICPTIKQQLSSQEIAAKTEAAQAAPPPEIAPGICMMAGGAEDTATQQYLRCPHCAGPLYVAATVKHWGMSLRRDGTCDLQERGAEYEIDHDSAYCGTCETEFESISALVVAAERK